MCIPSYVVCRTPICKDPKHPITSHNQQLGIFSIYICLSIYLFRFTVCKHTHNIHLYIYMCVHVTGSIQYMVTHGYRTGLQLLLIHFPSPMPHHAPAAVPATDARS